MKHGKIYPKKTLFLRIHVGEAKDQNKNTYELSTSANNASPIVCSKKTGKWFTLSWTDIMNLARDAGIDKADTKKKTKKPAKKQRTKNQEKT